MLDQINSQYLSLRFEHYKPDELQKRADADSESSEGEGTLFKGE